MTCMSASIKASNFWRNKMADKTRNPNRSNTENCGPARDASQPIRARDFTGSSLCHKMMSYKTSSKVL